VKERKLADVPVDWPSKVMTEVVLPGEEQWFEALTAEQKKILEAIKCTNVATYEVFRCPDPKETTFVTVMDPSNPADRARNTAIFNRSDITEVQSWMSFSDTDLQDEQLWWLNKMMQADLNDASRLKEKESYYWAFKLRSRAETLVPAVLESIPFLRDELKKDSWLLPNGEKVIKNMYSTVQ
jgi:hypothetical protein